MRLPLSSPAKLARRPKVAEAPAEPLPPSTVLARVPSSCDRLTRREREGDRSLADDLEVAYHESGL